jgi:hypothetical protein
MLAEAVVVTQLSSNAGTSDWRIVWVMNVNDYPIDFVCPDALRAIGVTS